ncbi:glycoside hydrolase family 99-like domain-containing protein [Nonomuraea sp. NPDC046570]|uniref:stalk domain-containing protein n=1 Tax=Nonomuraea sp. NPDC046570 TaxID=3155255 RepID=UPI00340380E4
MESDLPTSFGRRSFLQLVAALSAGAGLVASTELLSGAPAYAAPQPAAPTTPALLLDETFAFLVDFDPRQLTASGWELRGLGGGISYSFGNWFRLTDAAGAPTVGMSKRFRRVTTGSLTWEFRFQPIAGVEGATFSLLDDQATVGIGLTISGGQLRYLAPTGAVALTSVADGTAYGVRVIADLATDTVAIDVNGRRLLAGAAFTQAVTGLDTIAVDTAATSDLYLGPLRIAVGYRLLEDFVSVNPGNTLGGWALGGTGSLSVIKLNASRHADNHTLRLIATTGPATATTTLVASTAASRFDLSFFLPVNSNGLVIELWLGNGRHLRLSVANAKLHYRDATGADVAFSSLNFAAEIWHHVAVVLDGTTADIFHNSKQKATQVTLAAAAPSAPAKLTLTVAAGATAYFDDVKITDTIPFPSDYVPAPAPVGTGSYLVGVQSCSLWREGYHRGWDVINPHPERKPYLGFYDEGSPEVADWETKWLAENGISFQIYCWYRPQAGKGTAIKMPRLGMHLHEGFLESRYSSAVDFMIMWENAGEPTDSADFRKYIVPFWLEYYFKDPRYLKIDNKPVISIYKIAALITSFGSTAGVKAEIDYLRSRAVAAGFAGLIVLGTGTTATAALGFDAEYAYSRKGYFGPQTAAMLERRAVSTVDVLPTVSIGRDDLAWNGVPGDYAGPATFGDLAVWARDTFMPAAPVGALSRRMVILDNWNEYGEGHFLFPAELAGFAYLEAIRTAFGTSAGVAHTTPTPAQISRVTRLYPADRRFPPINATVPAKSSVFDHEWTFDTDGDLEGWSDLHGTITGMRVEAGALRGTATTTDPVVQTPSGLDFEAADHPYIRVKLSTSVPSQQEFFFVTPTEATYATDKGMDFCANPVPGTTDEYDIAVWRMPKWRGTIRQFRIDPLTLTGDFAIESVRVMYVPLPGPRARLNGALYPDLPVHTVGAVAFVPADFVFRRHGLKAEFRSANGRCLVRQGSSLIEAIIGSTTATRDGVAFTLDAAPKLGGYGEVLLPLSFFSGGLGATTSWNGTDLVLDLP